MSYRVLLGDDAVEYLSVLDEKSERIVKENLGKLADSPYPGRGQGDKEGGLTADGEEIYRMHIGRTHTAFYVIEEDVGEVRVFDVMPIDEAHKRYD